MTAKREFIAGLAPHLLWDVDAASLDAETHAAFLICRVMERGGADDVRCVWRFYGEARVRDALLHAPSLTRKTVRFFANQFRIPCEAFRSWQREQQWGT